MPDAAETTGTAARPDARSDARQDARPDNRSNRPEDFLSPATAVPPPGDHAAGSGPRARFRLARDTPPPTPGERAKWAERNGYDPKVEADKRRARGRDGVAHGGVHNGAWAGDPWPADTDLVRGPDPGPRDGIGPHDRFEPGIDDDVPPLPVPAAENRLRPRWEAFCRLYAAGHSAADAARHAGYAWDSAAQAGWRLLQDGRVQQRVAILQDYLARSMPVGAGELRVRAEAIYREAMNRGHYGAAIRAVEFLRRQLPEDASGNDENVQSPPSDQPD